MLKFVRFKKVIQDTKNLVSFETYESNRVDIAKKFLKKTPSGNNYYFEKDHSKLFVFKPTLTYVYLDKVYIIEAIEGGSTMDGRPILIVKDLLSFTEVDLYDRKLGLIKESSRGAW
jgi:hypothetical protein